MIEKVANLIGLKEDLDDLTKEEAIAFQESMKDDLLRLDVYFQDLNLNNITQRPKYDVCLYCIAQDASIPILL